MERWERKLEGKKTAASTDKSHTQNSGFKDAFAAYRSTSSIKSLKDTTATYLNFAIALVITILFCLLISGTARAQVNMEAIAMIESSNGKDLRAYSVSSHGVGKYQISQPVLDEYNRFHKTDYTKSQLLNDDLNYQVAYWYLEKRIPQMIRHFGKPVTVDNQIIAYNAGISYVAFDKPIPRITKLYLQKYAKAVAK